MIKNLIKKLYFRYCINELVRTEPLDEDYRQAGYVGLYQNIKMMDVLAKMLTADIKTLAKIVENKVNFDALTVNREEQRRIGMFIRTKAIIDKATEFYEKAQSEKPEIDNTIKGQNKLNKL